ncbi:DUF6776 family protein [Halioxenophilus sp. WMMB6]|uniref:DUF6776 family protein n=1 Tax=Halioxenophilus sp. WMMB6 TaxID=3073815 RepID=UPI00295E7209|nr:DUF6776 family protein [Halioxenophilus sp. WMMB6]
MADQKSASSARMVVVPHRPWRTPLMLLGWVLSILVTIAIASFTTSVYTRARIQDLELLNQNLEVELSQFEADAESLRQQVTNFRMSSDIDKMAAQDVRQEILRLQTHITELEQEISFYRGLMDPSSTQQGLGIGKVELFATTEPRRIHYRVVVQQVAANHNLVSGNLSVDIVGRLDGRAKTLHIQDLSEQIDSDGIKLRFKYFQTIEGEMLLPEGFEPQRLELEASASKLGSISEKIDWHVQEL